MTLFIWSRFIWSRFIWPAHLLPLIAAAHVLASFLARTTRHIGRSRVAHERGG
jgi:hypothetical protein